MSTEAWAVSLGAAMIGLLGGMAIALWKRPVAGEDGELRGQLALQSAELRRLADAAAQRELSAEQLRQGLDGARRSLEELRVRDQERRATDGEQREVVRRLATVLAGGASKGRAGTHWGRKMATPMMKAV